MDEFKKYLRENRHELDVEGAPRSEVWQRIQQQVPARRKTVVKPMLRYVAAAMIVLLTGTATIMLWQKPAQKMVVDTTPTDTIKVKPPEISGRTTDSSAPAISPLPFEVVAENTGAKTAVNRVPIKRKKDVRPAPSTEKSPMDMLQENYAGIINVQLKKLENTPIHVESAGYFHAFKKQWYDMEKDEKKIKDDTRLYGLTDAVLTQFIQLYQQKLLLLKQLQEEINKMNNRAQQYPEMQSKSPSYLKM